MGSFKPHHAWGPIQGLAATGQGYMRKTTVNYCNQWNRNCKGDQSVLPRVIGALIRKIHDPILPTDIFADEFAESFSECFMGKITSIRAGLEVGQKVAEKPETRSLRAMLCAPASIYICIQGKGDEDYRKACKTNRSH